MSKFSRAFTVCSSFLALAAFAGGCSSASSDGGSVTPKLEIINQTKSALSAGAISSVTGSYGSACGGHADGDPWTLSVSGGPASDELNVRTNDLGCILTVKDIVTANGPYIGAPAIALDTAWNSTTSQFALAMGPLAFYGNAKISALDFAANFTVTILVSDDPNHSDAGAAPIAQFQTQSGSVSASAFASPSYTLDFAGMTVTKDAGNVVLSTAGFAQLSAGAPAGEDYAVVSGNLSGAAFDVVDTAYTTATTKGTLASLASNQLPDTAFNLVGADLDTATYRTVIIRRTDTATGVSSYQYFSVLFN